jgi:hypothetical protein
MPMSMDFTVDNSEKFLRESRHPLRMLMSVALAEDTCVVGNLGHLAMGSVGDPVRFGPDPVQNRIHL